MRLFRHITTIAAMMLFLLPARAVTDKEMDQAKAIAAKEYLRWANDGSGYLEDFNATSMSDLTSKLKQKEKENLQAFNSVSIPSDYSSWNKDKLVEFWSVTFFTSPLLDEKGKRGKVNVKKKLQAMKVAEVPKEETPAPVEPDQSQAPEPTADMGVNETSMPSAETAVDQQEDILNDQNAIAEDEKLAEESRQNEDSHTWVYVLALVILVAIVIWLVVYAANVMKRQSRRDDDEDDEKERRPSESTQELKEQTRTAIARKNDEVRELRERLQREEARAADMGMELERLKLENSRLHQQIVKMREEAAVRTAPQPRRTAVEEPARESRRRENTSNNILKVIYLGRANQRGIFVRADRRITPGNTIYRLDTNDGLVGTFHVVDEPEVTDIALSDPTLYLGTACTGEDIEDTLGVSRIITESDGTAIFENGYWKVLRKTTIRYE